MWSSTGRSEKTRIVELEYRDPTGIGDSYRYTDATLFCIEIATLGIGPGTRLPSSTRSTRLGVLVKRRKLRMYGSKSHANCLAVSRRGHSERPDDRDLYIGSSRKCRAQRPLGRMTRPTRPLRGLASSPEPAAKQNRKDCTVSLALQRIWVKHLPHAASFFSAYPRFSTQRNIYRIPVTEERGWNEGSRLQPALSASVAASWDFE
jgi:hypothetical protein